MDNKLMLMIPGPTPVPEAALLALAKHPIGHRTGEFSNLMAEVTENLKWLHQTESDVLMLTASGTGAVEAGMINFLSPGDRILVGCNGKFGDRWAEVGAAYNLMSKKLPPSGDNPSILNCLLKNCKQTLKSKLKLSSSLTAKLQQGVLNDLETINRHVKGHGEALIIVDAVTSLGAVNLPMDAWGLDVVASGSQKGYMIPPGLGFVAVSPKAWEAYKTAKLPRYYLDLGKYRKSTAKNTTPFTPPVNLMVALHTTLRMMKAEGLEGIFARHQRLMNASRAGMKGLNLPLFAEDSYASPAITAVAPDKVDAEQIRAILKKKFDIALAGGQDHLKGKIFRIGHLGFVSDRDILSAIASLEVALRELGYEGFTPGAGAAAAARIIAQS
jgi:aspartate aminotransferase-like enzyme